MTINILHGNVLDAETDAIILTVDGAAKGMEGNLSRQFALCWSEAWREIQDEIRYPIPLGKVLDFEPVAGCSFQYVLLASTLHHLGAVGNAARQGIIRSAIEKSLKIAHEYKIKTIATPVMAGGWRLTLQDAFLSMIDGYEFARQNGVDVDLDVYVIKSDEYESIQALARTIGWR